jgi:hypothetical protein
MRPKNILLFTLAAGLLMTLPGCLKKGEDDPAISLRTRKARLTGTWKIQSGTEEMRNFYFATSPQRINKHTTTYSSTSYTQIREADKTDPSTETGSLSYEFEFMKDGGFTSTMVKNNHIWVIRSGIWNFTSGVGKHKNKDQIVIHINQRTSYYKDTNDPPPTEDILFTKYGGNTTDFTYYLKELRNKKLVLVSEYNYEDQPSIQLYSRYEELNFEQ